MTKERNQKQPLKGLVMAAAGVRSKSHRRVCVLLGLVYRVSTSGGALGHGPAMPLWIGIGRRTAL